MSQKERSVLSQTLLIAGYELLAIAKSVRMLLFVLGYGVSTYVAASVYVAAARAVSEGLEKQGMTDAQRAEVLGKLGSSPEFRAQLEPLLKWLGGPSLVDAILDGKLPWVVAVVLLLSSFAIPALVLLAGFDRISDDRSSKFLRFLVLRVRREAYLAGKLLGLFAAVLLAVLVVHLALLLRGAGLAEVELGTVAGSLPPVWAAMAVFLLAYAAFVVAVGAHVGPPFATLAVGMSALFALWIASFTSLGRAWMGTWDMRLWVLDPAALGVFFGHAAVFAIVGWLGVARRDV